MVINRLIGTDWLLLTLTWNYNDDQSDQDDNHDENDDHNDDQSM